MKKKVVKKPTLSKKEVKKILEDQKKPPMVIVASTRQIKLKDKDGKNSVTVRLMESFGFIPEAITVKKVSGQNNLIVISAIVPQKVLDNEKKEMDRLLSIK